MKTWLAGPSMIKSCSVACLIGVAAAAAAQEPPRALVADSPPFSARLMGASGELPWKLRFEVDGAAREVDASDLILWGGFVEPARGIHVLLAGGGLVVASNVRIEADRLEIESDRLGKLSAPLETIAGILFKPPLDRARRDSLVARAFAATAQRDRVLLDNGDELVGTILELSPNGAGLDTDAGKLEMESTRLAAVLFNPTLQGRRPPSGLRVVVGLADGCRLSAIAATSEEKTLLLKLSRAMEARVPLDGVVALQSMGGRARYLSDLTPVSYRHLPFLQLTWPLAVDRSVLGGMLRIGSTLYLKGLGMHSPSRVTYELAGDERRFESEVAVDAESGDRGSVVFRIFVDDGDGQWRDGATSEIVRGGQVPVTIAVELAGAKRISLLVDFADHGDELDHADWLNARLVK
jgi:hypothetical protein